MDRIAILSEELIDKIAAGEVVERPASIVKELVENSLDAGARHVRVALDGAGTSRILVVDDGHGMSRADAELAMKRHATSKLRDLDGLSRIATLGFRGEALPSIAAVSRFTLTTAEPDSRAGFRLRLEGGELVEQGEAPPIGGTSVEVEDLFFNVPARRKFMRRQQTELAQAQEAAVRLALAHLEVAFTFEHQGRVLLACPAGASDLRERLAIALGAEAHSHLIEVEEHRLGLSVTGYAARPDFTLPTARGIYTFVNRRYVRDRGLNYSIQRAYRDVVPQGRQPVLALMIEVDPRSVDVNVHPQKIEVRFADPTSVYDAVFTGLQKALRQDLLRAARASIRPSPDQAPDYAHAVQQFLERARESGGGGAPLPRARSPEVAYGLAPQWSNAARPAGYFSSLRYLGTARNGLWICDGPEGFLVGIDPHAALERLRRNSLERLRSSGAASDQRSLFSANVKVSAEQVRALEGARLPLLTLGLEVEAFGPEAIAIRSLPAELMAADRAKLLADLAAALLANADASAARILSILACHAVGETALLSAEQIQTALSALDGADFSLDVIHQDVVGLEVALPRRA